MRPLLASAWTEWLIALRFLLDNRMQTLLILFGITVGSAVIVFITALITGLQENVIERTLGTQAHIRILPLDEFNRLAPLPDDAVSLVLESPRAQRLRSISNWQDVVAVLDQHPRLPAVSPVVSGPALALSGVARASVALIGMDPERYERIIPVSDDLIAGAFRVGAGHAVIGSELAGDLGLDVGDKLRLDGGDGREAVVDIAGIFELGVRELDARYVYLDLKQAQTLLALPGGVTVIDTRVDEIFAADELARRIERLTGLQAESWMQTNGQLLNALTSQSMTTEMIRVFVGISVAFGIASVLAVSVVQRTREIGILRAMGSPRGQILRVFLLQGGLLGLIGSGIGGAVGWGLVQIFNIFGPGLFWVPVEPALVPVAMLIATLAGVLAAAVPARRAARYDPAVAIRYV
ncbi:ABC transporter permease [Pseudomonas sp. G11-1]|uniref:Lipoprotein-releasing system permease protein n=1 Tax=Halopseudomonas bauzanensis TaxID=653930 RepID=A0A031MFS2_9GAMM|nr:FtsX-like permease family protein [Halopseudomonas bauzanensis]MCO5787197.1 ABC transporter permease [Pseudomonas sp. G11-1]MCO5790423.1 ABC transporter permease [Pseudomonas sp. G11-2]EZQ18850.1 membrane protein [Halopseudomonas bauzanensis]SES27058.1 lipoprotein-releasing system permease protein [Halopseudomonas bauzanensis]SFM23049.1 lipoprotein-releasing system permease protein [Halopseudomonas bauzanensis]